MAMGRYDFFELLKLTPGSGAVAGRRYAANLDAASPGSAGELASRLRDLRGSFTRDDPLRLGLSLDRAIERYDVAQGAAAPTLDVLMAATRHPQPLSPELGR